MPIPVVVEARRQGLHPSRIRRVGIYTDAAPYTKNDSFEGYFINDLDTGKRYMTNIVRKHDLCDCGCKGWDSLYHLHAALK